MDAMLEQINSTGKAFVDFALPMLVQSSVLIVVLLGLDLILRTRIRAVSRYWIWMMVLLKLVLPTTLSLPTSPAYWLADDVPSVVAQEPIAPAESEIARAIAETPAATLTLQQRTLTPRPVESIRLDPDPVVPVEASITTAPAVPAPSLTWQGLAVLLWLAVVAAMTLLLVQRTFFVRRLVAQSNGASAEMVDIFEQGRRRMKVRRRVSLRLSPVAASPSVCGLFRPTILIPQGLTDKLNSKHLRPIILHELAHIKRGDLWVSLFQTVLQIFYVYNPLLWLANVMIRKIREEAVDELVLVAMGEQAEDYPRTLLDVSRLTFGRPALSLRLIGVVESRKALAGRIRHMASKPFPRTARLGVVGLLGVVITAAVLLPMARAQRDGTAGTAAASTFEGQLEFHKPLAVGIAAGTGEHPELVRIDWIRFETIYGNSWGVTARVGWSLATNACWRLRVELLDEKGQVLRHSRDEATVFTTKAGGPGQTEMRYVDLALDPMQYEGRRHAKRFRVYLEPWQEQVQSVDSAGLDVHALEVVVIDQESRAPIADSTVLVSNHYFRETYRIDRTLCSTDSKGRCRVGFDASGLLSISVHAQKPGFASIAKSWSSRGSSPFGRVALPRLPQRHVLEMIRAGSLGGIVRNTQGDPIEGVEVRLYSYLDEPSGAIGVNRTVRTDANGRWRVEGVPVGADRVTLDLKHARYGGDSGGNRRITGQALLDAQAFKHVEVLQKGRIVTGKVLDDRGKPIAWATVMLTLRSGYDVRGQAITDESGAFELAVVVDTSAHREPAALIAEAPGYAPAERMIYPTSNMDAVEFRLTRGKNVTCRVVDKAGRPLDGAWTVVKPLPGNVRYGIWLEDTDEQGRFLIPNAPTNDFKLTVGKAGYINVRDFAVGGSEDKVVITMKRAMQVSGTVTDAESGRPIPDFEIAVGSARQNRPLTDRPAAFAEGAYELSFEEARSEPLQLQVSAIGYEPATSQEFRIEEGQRIMDFKLERSSTYDETTAGRPREQIKPTGPRRIKGVAHDADGNPVANAVVSIQPSIAEQTTTNTEGAFTLTTRRLSSMGSFADPAREKATYLFVRHKDRNLAAALELDERAESVDIKMNPGVILTGEVVDPDGKGIGGAEVDLRFYDSGTVYGSRDVTKADSQGHYQIRAVPSDQRYFVFATAEGYGEQYVDVQTAEAEDDRMELEPLVLAMANLSLSGVVVDVDGKPAANVRVYAYGRGQPHRDTITDENGRFVIENMCEGRVQIQANRNVPPSLHGRFEAYGGQTDMKIVVAETSRSGSRVPRQPPSLVGKKLPELRDISLVFEPEQHKDKMILACFWDMNQRPSRNCITQLAGRAERLGEEGVVIAAIQASEVDLSALDEWVRANNIPFPVGTIPVDHERIRWAWGVRSLPWLILTDRNHVVRKEGFGLSELDEEVSSSSGEMSRSSQSKNGLELAGRILTEDGQPVAGATVCLGNTYVTDSAERHRNRESLSWQGGLSYPASLQSESDGRFVFNFLLAGTTDVWAEHPRWGWAWIRDIRTDAKDIELRLKPQPQQIRLSGRVLDADREPSKNARILIYTKRGDSFVAQTESDAEGQFEVEVDPPWTHFRQLALLCVPESGPPAWRIMPYCSAANLQIQLKREATITGRVVNSKGEGVANDAVRFDRAKDRDYGITWFSDDIAEAAPSTRTDAIGNFTIRRVPLGSSVSLRAEHPDYGSEGESNIEANSEGIRIADIQLPDGITVEGTVRFAGTNEVSRGIKESWSEAKRCLIRLPIGTAGIVLGVSERPDSMKCCKSGLKDLGKHLIGKAWRR